jgi:hypothetical protein
MYVLVQAQSAQRKRVVACPNARSQHLLPSRTPYIVTPSVLIPTPWARAPTSLNNTYTEAFGPNAMHTHAVTIYDRSQYIGDLRRSAYDCFANRQVTYMSNYLVARLGPMSHSSNNETSAGRFVSGGRVPRFTHSLARASHSEPTRLPGLSCSKSIPHRRGRAHVCVRTASCPPRRHVVARPATM